MARRYTRVRHVGGGHLSFLRFCVFLVSSQGYEAKFIISNTRISDAGIYQCSYCFKSSTETRCSHYSDKAHINIADPSIPKPSIKVKPGYRNALHSSVSIECQGQEDDLNFFLRKANTGEILQESSALATGTATFHFFQVRSEDAGSYICQYHHRSSPFIWSEPSDPVKLIVEGQGFPKPSISVSPSDMVILRGNFNIQCRNEKVAQVEFGLFKEGRALLFRNAELHEAVFSLVNVKQSDSGVYWCKYHIRNFPFDQWSPDSDPVHINIIDPSFTKPFINVSSKGKFALDSKATIECQSKENGLTFSLRKSGKLIASLKTEPNGNTAKFLLSMGRREDAGNYSCQYQHRENPFVWSEPSDPVELVVTGESSIVILASCVVGLFLVLFFFLLAIVWYKRRRKCSTANEENQPVTRPLKCEASTDYDGVTSGVEQDEFTNGTDNDGLTYVVLNHQPPKSKEVAIPGNPSESCIYASVAKDRASGKNHCSPAAHENAKAV
ncbi:immunoglobulin superfamily member 1-like [Heteronotia binoei]|uniref:immunoglobulin superfamily member 1-like n=1 Tax=Heteronotia binoei TaxID=13085 RepID=UPI00292E7204|nr:immunoglobulin superfamily member 1-like [Heteronotia binoei]